MSEDIPADVAAELKREFGAAVSALDDASAAFLAACCGGSAGLDAAKELHKDRLAPFVGATQALVAVAVAAPNPPGNRTAVFKRFPALAQWDPSRLGSRYTQSAIALWNEMFVACFPALRRICLAPLNPAFLASLQLPDRERAVLLALSDDQSHSVVDKALLFFPRTGDARHNDFFADYILSFVTEAAHWGFTALGMMTRARAVRRRLAHDTEFADGTSSFCLDSVRLVEFRLRVGLSPEDVLLRYLSGPLGFLADVAEERAARAAWLGRLEEARPELRGSCFGRKILAAGHNSISLLEVMAERTKEGAGFGDLAAELFNLPINMLYGLLLKDEVKGEFLQEPEMAAKQVIQLRIVLEDTNPPIWRRIQLEDCSLDKLHGHIQCAMGWKDSHLHQFTASGTTYGIINQLAEDKYDAKERGLVSSRRTRVSQLISELSSDAEPGSSGSDDTDEPSGEVSFKYEYDFGDGWEHRIIFEGYFPHCGGPWNFREFVMKVTDPAHRDHKAALNWLQFSAGKNSFDPEEFDSNVATYRMMDGLPRY
ncbi:MM3350-like domain-containing protein [Hyaloraphidium curvatum]|nr:MM3350-like domain-containing protein [Hyaloraphidium curvatum]